MAERPLVTNAKVINLLNSAPVRNLRPALGSLIQRKTIDIGCYPFPFMVNEQNVPLDGRVIGGVTFDTRPVPYWCSENAYADKYGDPTYNNGEIVWEGGRAGIKQKGTGNQQIVVPDAFRYDSALGVTYPTRRVNMSFVGMEETVPVEWQNLKNAYYARGVTFTPEDGVTLGIASNVLFKVWTGLTVETRTTTAGTTYTLRPMSRYILSGGTYSPFFSLYNFQCLDQVFNSPFITQVGGDPNAFWEGSGYGLSFGVSAGTTGELFLLNAVYAGNNPNLAGSYYLENAGSCADFPYSQFFLGATAGSTFSGRQLAINMAGAGGVVPFLRTDEPYPGRSFIDTMALILGTNQTSVTLVTGGTASIRSIDFNNPCSSSLLYREDTELGRWGYDIERINLEYQTTPPPIPTDFGCHIGSFIEYMSGPTARQNGLYHPLSLMFWRQISSGTDVQGTINDYAGDDPVSSEPVINKLEGIHDYLCYEYYSGSNLESRVYYPIRPITKQWYDSNFIPAYTSNGGGDSETVGGFGVTLENKFSVGFDPEFRGRQTAITDAISLKYLEQNQQSTSTIFNFLGGVSNLAGVTGVAFPYMIPIFTYGMKGIPAKTLDIQGDFQNFESWNRDLFGIGDDSLNPKLYPYYADGVSSGADFGSDAISPYYFEELGGKHNFRLYSWDALNKISPNDTSGSPVRSSFSALPDGDGLGRLTYEQTGEDQTIEMDGTEVSVDPLLFPPAVLPSEPIGGLKVDGINLGCDAYVNLVRYANSVSLDNTTPGLTAKRVLLSSKDLSNSTQTFAQFDGGSDPLDDPEQVFTRTGDAPNASDNFYTPVGGNLPSGGNFFFRTAGSTLTVFGGSYYLTPSDYVTKYLGGTEFAGNWWENVSVPTDQIDGIAALISDLLSAPNPEDAWSSDTTTSLFKGGPYDFELEAPNGTGGIAAALGGENRLHPAFVYRLLTSSALGSDPFYTESCLESWSYGGTPCHKVPDIIEPFYSGFDSYFGSGETGCGQYGQDEVDENSYLDFFYRCRLGDDDFTSDRIYAYSAAYFNPELNPPYSYQNEGCNTSGGGIPDPPAGATLTPFGLTFASALAAVAETDIDFGDQSQTGRLAVRNVFGFSGNTATDLPNGNDNNVETPVSQWLQEKLESLFDFYNENYPATDAPTKEKVEKVNRFFTALYGQDFTDYEAGLQNSKTYKLWAIKPRCLEEMDADCLSLARQLLSSNQTAAATDGGNYIFRDPKPPADKSTKARISDLQRSNISPNRPITTSDITPTNDGFLSAFQTIYVEPLGKAPNVLATQAQAVSRATIRSTVFGKLISVIDSRGMLRDANVITLESGFGTKITGSSGGNAITISVEGLSLGSLNDVSSVAATDGDVLSYDLVNSRWTNRSLYDLNDMHAGMRYTFSDSTEPLFNLNIGQVGGADLTTVLANAGTLKFNAKSEEVPTEVYFSVSDANGNDQTQLFNRFGTGVAGTLLLKKFGDPNTFFRFQVDGLTGPYAERTNAVAADTGLRVSLINSGTGTLSAGDRLAAFLFLEPATNRVNFYYQALPPTGAGVTGGSRWMNSETGTEYIYINDGDTNQWVQAV